MKKLDITIVISCVGFLLIYTSQFMITWDRYKKAHKNAEDISELVRV